MERYLLYFGGGRIVLDPDRNYLIGRSEKADILLEERTVSRKHAELRFDGRYWLIEDLASTNGTQVNHIPSDRARLKDGDRISVGPYDCVFKIFSGEEQEEREFEALLNETLLLERKFRNLLSLSQNESIKDEIYDLKHFLNSLRRRMNDLANIDRLTGLYNRRYFDQQYKMELARAIRYSHGLALVMIDIDHFKAFNDTHGHQKGDEVLSAVGEILKEHSRSTDLVARYGGEEMVVVMPELTPGEGGLAAEKFRRRIETESRERCGLQVTASLGVASVKGEQIDAEELISRADKALYEAKKSGRNRVVCAP